MSAGPYAVRLHTAREIEGALAAAYGEGGTDEQRDAVNAVLRTIDLMRSHSVRCILCDSAIEAPPRYVALVWHVGRPGWGAGVICRRCGNRQGRSVLAEQAAQRAHLVFGVPQGHG